MATSIPRKYHVRIPYFFLLVNIACAWKISYNKKTELTHLTKARRIMRELDERILHSAVVSGENIVRMDTFLNHCIDVPLLERLGKELSKRFRGARITKVLTAESSGIALACFSARELGVPAIYAKKFQSGYIDPDVYTAEVHSFSLEKSYTLRVSKACLDEDDTVLIMDDILSSGQAPLGLIEIVSKAGGEVAGVAVAVEKAMCEGGGVLRRMGIRVEAVSTILSIEQDTVVLA